MQDQEVDQTMEPQELSSTLLEPNKMDMSLSSIFNMDDDFWKNIPNLSPNISPLRKNLDIQLESNKLGEQIFKKVLDSRYNYSPFSKYPNLNFSTFGRAEVPCCKNFEPVNSPRSYLSNKADSRSNSRLRVPPINFEQQDPEKRMAENSSSYKKLKIPRLNGFQLYPTIANEISNAVCNPVNNSQMMDRNDQESVPDNSNSSNYTFDQHDSTHYSKDSEMVGRLTRKQREAKVKRFLEKRKRRQFNKKVCYESRKKVADTRPRYKGRFVSFEQMGELADEYKKDLQKRLEKDRVFVTEIFNKKTKELRKVIFPNQETMAKYNAKNVV